MGTVQRKAGALQGILLILPITMAVMGLVVLVPVLPAMTQHFSDVPGIENLVGLVLTLPALCVALFSGFAGIVVDFFGRRRTLIGALFVYAIVGMLPMVLESLTAIIIARFALGIMEALIIIASTTLIGDYYQGDERKSWLSYQTAVASIASIFLALLGGALGEISWRGPFAAYGLSIVFAVLLMIFTWEPEKNEEDGTENSGGKVTIPWKHILPIAALAVFGGVMFFTMQIQVTTFLSDYFSISSSSELGMYAGIAGLCVAIGTLVYRFITSRFTVSAQLLIAFSFLGVSYVAMNFVTAISTFTTALVINQLGCGMLLPTLAVWAMGRLPFEVRGRGTGLFMTGWWIGQPLSSQAVPGLRSQMGGSLPATLQLLGILCLVAAVIALISSLRRKSTAEL